MILAAGLSTKASIAAIKFQPPVPRIAENAVLVFADRRLGVGDLAVLPLTRVKHQRRRLEPADRSGGGVDGVDLSIMSTNGGLGDDGPGQMQSNQSHRGPRYSAALHLSRSADAHCASPVQRELDGQLHQRSATARMQVERDPAVGQHLEAEDGTHFEGGDATVGGETVQEFEPTSTQRVEYGNDTVAGAPCLAFTGGTMNPLIIGLRSLTPGREQNWPWRDATQGFCADNPTEGPKNPCQNAPGRSTGGALSVHRGNVGLATAVTAYPL
jgi:hypothetical protein